jgi:hypothetical protein
VWNGVGEDFFLAVLLLAAFPDGWFVVFLAEYLGIAAHYASRMKSLWKIGQNLQ